MSGLQRGSQEGKRRGSGTVVRALLVGLLIACAGVAAWVWREPLWATFGDRAHTQAWVASFGPWAPLVTVVLNVIQVLLAPLPGQFVGMVNGYLYGVWLGTLYSMAGVMLGTALAMALGRWLGRPLVERLVDPERLARWDGVAAHRGPLFFFLVFLFPFLPDDLTCFLVGLSSLSIPRMLLLVTPARLPGVFVSCWVGAYATSLPWWAWVPLGGGAIVLAWGLWRYQSYLERLMLRAVRQLTRRETVKRPG